MGRLATTPIKDTYQSTIFEWINAQTPVFPSEKWDSFRFIDLFAGIGGIRLGFESVGGHCVFSSEWDEQAAKTYEANFGPLCIRATTSGNHWDWISDPWPWEEEANFEM